VYRPSNDIDCIVSIDNMSWSNLHLETSLQASDYDRGRILQLCHRVDFRISALAQPFANYRT
jgi:hypothetical protein